jgi:hypothetical protein
VSQVDLTTAYVDSGLTNGQSYCYAVTARYADCESPTSNVLCATPNNQGQARVAVDQLQTGRWEGSGNNQQFVLTTSFNAGDVIIIQARVVDAGTGQPVPNATVELAITGPENLTLTSGPSNNDGIAESAWRTTKPKGGRPGTPPGAYTATVANVSAAGYTWDGVSIAFGFTIN